MLGIRKDRMWAACAGLIAMVLLVGVYFLLIEPAHQRTGEFHEQTRAAQDRATTLEHRIAELKRQSSQLDQYKADLARDRQALPTTSGMPDFLRELQTAATATGVNVTTVVVGGAAPVTGLAGVYAIPLTLTVTGTAAQYPAFLDRIQNIEPRAVLLNSVNVIPDGESKSVDGKVTLTLTMQAFVAPAVLTPSTGPDS